LNVYIFFDGVLLGFFFVFGFILFLKYLLPLLCFFYKSSDYLTLYLLKELNSKYLFVSPLYINYLLYLKNNVFCFGRVADYNFIYIVFFIFFCFYFCYK